jgi:uncharacterized protein (UPF0332 family)
MPEFASSKTLLRVSTAKKSLIDDWKEGRYLETESGRDLPSLVERATSDRVMFAAALLRDAERLATRDSPQYRASISRSYYAMYHAMRAAVYFAHGGDDHQEHRALPTQAPADMTARDDWSNKLKGARERRNAADYDPYPKSDTAWRKRAEELIPQARGLLREVRIYLRLKGCRFV